MYRIFGAVLIIVGIMTGATFIFFLGPESAKPYALLAIVLFFSTSITFITLGFIIWGAYLLIKGDYRQ